MNRYTLYALTLSQMVRAELSLAIKGLPDKLIDLTIYIVATLSVATYLLPSLGMSDTFGVFSLAGLIASAGLFEAWPGAINLINDLTGENITAYYLTLPIPSALVFVRLIIIYAFNGLMLSLASIPLGMLVLWGNTAGLAISPLQLGIAVIAMNIFFGCFTLWVASFMKNMMQAGNVWMRFVFPLWFFGGFQFSWNMLYNKAPLFAYIDLLNPVIYAMEASKGALLGQTGYIPFGYCICALIIGSIAIGTHAVMRLKKRLNCI